MTYTNEQRQAIADVFKKARKQMKRNPPWGGYKYQHSRYICDNLEARPEFLKLALDVITQRLGGRFSVDYWLRDEGHISAYFA